MNTIEKLEQIVIENLTKGISFHRARYFSTIQMESLADSDPLIIAGWIAGFGNDAIIEELYKHNKEYEKAYHLGLAARSKLEARFLN